jgi:hypothetical protein
MSPVKIAHSKEDYQYLSNLHGKVKLEMIPDHLFLILEVPTLVLRIFFFFI